MLIEVAKGRTVSSYICELVPRMPSKISRGLGVVSRSSSRDWTLGVIGARRSGSSQHTLRDGLLGSSFLVAPPHAEGLGWSVLLRVLG